MTWTKVCLLSELSEGEGYYSKQGDFELAIFLSRGKVHAMDNHCPHAGGVMSGGYIRAGCAVCPWHGWAFRLDNGQLEDAPEMKIPIYETRIIDGNVEVNLPDEPPPQ